MNIINIKERGIIWTRLPSFFDRLYPRQIPMVTSKESYRYHTGIFYSVKEVPLCCSTIRWQHSSLLEVCITQIF